MSNFTEVAVVGAGPYGLSIAAHLGAHGVPFRIFGVPMQTWRDNMPEGMLLKSDGFASNLSDPAGAFTLKGFCQTSGVAYDDTRIPVPIEAFIAYGQAFQKKMVPSLEQRQVLAVRRDDELFRLELDGGEQVEARRVVMAVGIRQFAYLPENFSGFPEELVSHSSAHKHLAPFRGRSVAILGAGASAIDLAALLHESGAEVSVVARRPAIRFHTPPPEKRSLGERLRNPSSGLGPGWKSRFYTDAPRLFRQFPGDLRVRIVREHLGPAPGWPMRERVEGKIAMHLGVSDVRPERQNGEIRLRFTAAGGQPGEVSASHLICATGYRPSLDRIAILSPELRERIATVGGTPALSSGFESSVPGLYFTGISAANTFGPMMRFTFGADYAARHLVNPIVKTLRRG